MPLGSPGTAQAMCGTTTDRQVSNDPYNCAVCSDNPTTPQINETGKCLDANADSIPDDALLLPDIVSITCGSQTWSNTEDDGVYIPSGNQLVPVISGLFGLGPALIVQPPQLRSDSTCTLTFAASVVDKDGIAIALDPAVGRSAITFDTEALSVLTTSPEDATTVPGAGLEIAIEFNTLVEPTSVSNTTVTVSDGGGAVAGTYTVDNTIVTFTPAADPLPAGTYTVTVTTSVQDTLGSPLPASSTFSFMVP